MNKKQKQKKRGVRKPTVLYMTFVEINKADKLG